MTYASAIDVESQVAPGVRLRVRRMSFGRRMELTRRLHELLAKLEFLRAGEGSSAEAAESALVGGEIDREYLRWGLAGVEGLEIDGRPASAEDLIESGPEELVDEALRIVREQAGLTEAERKNSESHSISSTGAEPDGNATVADGWARSESGAADGATT